MIKVVLILVAELRFRDADIHRFEQTPHCLVCGKEVSGLPLRVDGQLNFNGQVVYSFWHKECHVMGDSCGEIVE